VRYDHREDDYLDELKEENTTVVLCRDAANEELSQLVQKEVSHMAESKLKAYVRGGKKEFGLHIILPTQSNIPLSRCPLILANSSIKLTPINNQPASTPVTVNAQNIECHNHLISTVII
jgi:hypothetical protein